MFALPSRGAGGAAPCKKNDVILRSARRPRGDEGSRAASHLQEAARCHNKEICCELPKN